MVSLGIADAVDAGAEEVVNVLRVVGGAVVATLGDDEVEEGIAAHDFATAVDAPGQGLKGPTITSVAGRG